MNECQLMLLMCEQKEREADVKSKDTYLQHLPSAVEMFQSTCVLHGQMDIRDGQLMGEIIDLLHAFLHLTQLLLKQLQRDHKQNRVRKCISSFQFSELTINKSTEMTSQCVRSFGFYLGSVDVVLQGIDEKISHGFPGISDAFGLI